MELHERIKQIRKEKKLTRQELHEKLLGIFGKKTIKPNTIWRIESGLTSARTSSLHQLCVGLDISLRELLASVETVSRVVDFIKKDKRIDQYIYDPKAKAEILTPPKLNFLTEELTLSPAGMTKTEQDPIEMGKFEKWVYCLSGKVLCSVGAEKHLLNKGDCLSFESNIPHSFENPSTRKARFLVVQNPKHI